MIAKRSSAPITVVIPAYNAEHYLEEAVESVNAQSLSVLETIVADDGSTDGTAAIAAKLGTQVIRQDRAGVSAARNAAMRAAKGEWIAFLDADDTWMPEKIAEQWQAIEHYPQIGIISCDHCTYEADRVAEPSYLAGLLGNSSPAHRRYVTQHRIYFPKIDAWFFSMKWILLPSTVLIHRNILDDVGDFNEDLRCVEDYEYFMRILARYPLAVVDNVLMRYRLHQDNIHRDIALMQASILRYFDIVITSPERYPIGAFRAAVRGRSSHEARPQPAGEIIDRSGMSPSGSAAS